MAATTPIEPRPDEHLIAYARLLCNLFLNVSFELPTGPLTLISFAHRSRQRDWLKMPETGSCCLINTSLVTSLSVAAWHGRLVKSCSRSKVTFPSDTVAQTFLTPVPPLTSELSTRPIPPLSQVRRRREEYVEALKVVMQAPDGNYEPEFTLPGQSRPPTPTEKSGEYSRNNPLSLDEEVSLFPSSPASFHL